LLASGGLAFAASFSEDVVAQLVRLGFSDITAETTLLGRIRIVARRGDGVREIVLNPRTGEVLRDTWVPGPGGRTTRTVISDVADDDRDDQDTGGNSGPGGRDDDRDDRDDDRDDRDDRQDDRQDDRDDRRDDREDRNDDRNDKRKDD
jgi:hypothetical protein